LPTPPNNFAAAPTVHAIALLSPMRRGWSSCGGFAFALGVTVVYALFGPALIDIMTASTDVRLGARQYLWLVVLAPALGVFAFAYDGIFIGATWAREMRNLMILSLLGFLATWFALRGLGNTGLWIAMLVLYASRGGLQALRYPVNLRASFGDGLISHTAPSTEGRIN
jgi:MATE family multidrug resistance protein